MAHEETDLHASALSNINNALVLNKTFPDRVIGKDFSRFFVFNADMIAGVRFIDYCKIVMEYENSRICILAHLEKDNIGINMERYISVDRRTSYEYYYKLLEAGGAEEGWLYDMGTYACASDKGDWCMYLERANEIGVLGFKNIDDEDSLKNIIETIDATPSSHIGIRALSGEFPFSDFTDDWKVNLEKSYP